MHARDDGGWIAVRRFVYRHRSAVIGSVVVLLLIIASSVVAWTLYTQAHRARLVADEQRREARQRLYDAYVSEAETERATRRAARRERSLDRLRRAAAIQPSPDVRDGVIASLTLTDLELLATTSRTGKAMARGLVDVDRVVRSCTIAPSTGRRTPSAGGSA